MSRKIYKIPIEEELKNKFIALSTKAKSFEKENEINPLLAIEGVKYCCFNFQRDTEIYLGKFFNGIFVFDGYNNGIMLNTFKKLKEEIKTGRIIDEYGELMSQKELISKIVETFYKNKRKI